MPTAFIERGYRFFFYSFDCKEPRHIHVQREKFVCKFWLQPVVLSKNHGFTPKELNVIRQIVSSRGGKLLEAWDEHCG